MNGVVGAHASSIIAEFTPELQSCDEVVVRELNQRIVPECRTLLMTHIHAICSPVIHGPGVDARLLKTPRLQPAKTLIERGDNYRALDINLPMKAFPLSIRGPSKITLMVPSPGLEPGQLAPLPPQDSVSTNSTMTA